MQNKHATNQGEKDDHWATHNADSRQGAEESGPGVPVQFGRSVMSDSLWPHGLQHARIPCPSPSPRAYSNSCPLSRWCHLTISSCHPLLLLPPIFPASGSFPISQSFASGVQKYWSFSFSISLSNEYSGLISFRTDCYDLLAVQGTFENLLQHHSWKASILQCSAIFMVQLSHLYTWLLEKP